MLRWSVAVAALVATVGGCGGDEDPGVVAFWELAPGEVIDADTISFSVLVHGTHCSGTETDTVLAPSIDERASEVRITYFVEPPPAPSPSIGVVLERPGAVAASVNWETAVCTSGS